jgi:hypothetical protein
VTDDVVPIDSVKNSLAIRAIITIEEQHFFRVLSQRHNWPLFFHVIDVLMTSKPANG